MRLFIRFIVLLGHISSVISAPTVDSVALPAIPLYTSSRWIMGADNSRIKMKCVNWAGHMETHLPEGLHKQSIDYLATWIANQGFNCVRLTYSIDYALNPTVKVSDAFNQAAGSAGVSADAMRNLYNMAVVKNPFLATATTQDVFASVVDTLWSKGVMTVMDNHVSKASWCCNLSDGNGWWDSAQGYNDANSRYFNTSNWLDGLQATATWAQGHKGIVAMSLRNEIRQFGTQGLNGPYDDWYDQLTQAAKLVHENNPDVLIVVGGMLGGTDLSTVDSHNLDTTAWSGKHVWEFHAYSYSPLFKYAGLGLCTLTKPLYGKFDGFVLTQGQDSTAPLFLSEFGVGMTGGPNKGLNDDDNSYLTCLVGYMESNDAEWAVWALQGTYYVRNGMVDYDETWGLLDSTWTDWRNSNFPGMLGGMWNTTQGP